MADQCAQRPDEGTLAGVFYPSMDHSSISDLVHYRIGSGAEVWANHTHYFAELREYVRTRDARERALAPIAAKKMEGRKFC